MSNQENNQFESIQSLESLTKMAEANVAAGQQAKYENVEVQKEESLEAKPQQPLHNNEEYNLKINSSQYVSETSTAPQIQPTLAEDSVESTSNNELNKAISATTNSSPLVKEASKYEDSDFEATLAEDSKREKETGTRVPFKNATLTEMRKLRTALEGNTSQAEKVTEVLKNAVIDLDNIIIEDNSSDPLALHKQVELIGSTAPKISFPIVCLKSGYKADLAPLTNNEKIESYNLNGSLIDVTIKLAKIVHSKIVDSSIGRINFNRFLDITAESEFDTLLYGIYCASFPGVTTYTVKCPHCKKEINLPLTPGMLVEIVDSDKDRSISYVQKVLQNYDKGAEFLKESLVSTTKRVILPESKIIVDLKTPTMRNMIDSMRLVDSNSHYGAELVNTKKYISGMYIPNLSEIAAGRTVYSKLPDTDSILNFLDNTISNKDLSALRNEISDYARTYSINYAAPDFNCPSAKCGKEIKDINIDMTNLLFFAIKEGLTIS